MTVPPRPRRSETEQAANGRMPGDVAQGDTRAPPQSNPGTECSDSGASAQILDAQIACVHPAIRYTCRSPAPRHSGWPRPGTQVGRDLSGGGAPQPYCDDPKNVRGAAAAHPFRGVWTCTWGLQENARGPSGAYELTLERRASSPTAVR